MQQYHESRTTSAESAACLPLQATIKMPLLDNCCEIDRNGGPLHLATLTIATAKTFQIRGEKTESKIEKSVDKLKNYPVFN
jgi:hypothetical protein